MHRLNAALACDFGCHTLNLFSGSCKHGDPRALARKRKSDSATNAAPASGNQCNFVF